MKKLPIGIQTFREIITENYYYADKTKLIPSLLNGKYYFLSRPRRFGKSLFLDTLREAFLGHKKYFQGLYLENYWDWSKSYPVIRIDFGSGVIKKAEVLEKVIHEILNEHANQETIHLKNETISGRFRELIIALNKKYSERVVILVDEYDKPILDNITETDTALQMREGLRNLYSVIKSADAFIKFVFITGVSKFSKVNLFSGLNNIQDITLDERYATICGYTEAEVLEVFAERLGDVNIEELRRWYNGYNFLGERVYNPFDILLFISNKYMFRNYW
ncbi:MAG: AAA family ATPase, partial [Leptospiraceae bacterium]|nr:AAA family ATPase [Leptospiraceae bacterium]